MNADVRIVLSALLCLGLACAGALAAPAHVAGGAVAAAHPAAGPVASAHFAAAPMVRPLPVSPETCGRGGVRGSCGANQRLEHEGQSASLQCQFKPDQCAALAAIRAEALTLRRADGGSLSAAHRAALQAKLDALFPAAQ